MADGSAELTELLNRTHVAGQKHDIFLVVYRLDEKTQTVELTVHGNHYHLILAWSE